MTTYRQRPPAGVRRPAADYVGTREAAAILGRSERTVARMADHAELTVAWRTTGGHRRFLRDYLYAIRNFPTTPPEDQ